MSLAENLQYLRARVGVPQEQLAERLDVSRQSVSKWESGASYPEMDTILKLCDMFHVDLDSLMRGNVERTFSEDSVGYDRFMTNYARKVAGAVAAMIAGVALWCLMQARDLPQELGMAAFLLIVAAAVVVLIASGMEEEHFRKRHPTIPDFYSEQQKELFHRRFIWYIAGGVGAILCGVVLVLLGSWCFPQTAFYEGILGAVFLLIVAAGTFFLVYGGMLEDKYNIRKYNWENNPTEEEIAQKRKATAACGIIMLLATAVFLFMGLQNNLWDSAAVIYPVAGVLCGVAWVVLTPKHRGD